MPQTEQKMTSGLTQAHGQYESSLLVSGEPCSFSAAVDCNDTAQGTAEISQKATMMFIMLFRSPPRTVGIENG